MELTEQYLRTLYERLLKFAILSERCKGTRLSNRFLELLARISYTYYLRFHDERVESLVVKLSRRIKKTNVDIKPIKKRFVFLDSLGIYNGGLIIQYIDALREQDCEVLFIADYDMDHNSRKALKEYLLVGNRVNVLQIPRTLTGDKKLQFIYNRILDFSPSTVLGHLSPYAPYFAEVLYALPYQIKTFLIDYTDHSFILGSSCANYIIEFRNYGCSIANIWRHIDINRIIYLPYYPNIINKTFKGVPDICEGKHIILSGGNIWKIFDENDTYLKLSKAILEENPNVLLLYAGIGDTEKLKRKLKKYDIEDKFILLGWREDIYKLFETCHLYLSTYPVIGGLMGQYAAILGKPILSLSDPGKKNNVESTVCQLSHVEISKYSIDDVVNESIKLLSDSSYYKSVSDELKKCVITPSQFADILFESIQTGLNKGPKIKIDKSVCIREKQLKDTISYKQESWRREFVGFFKYLTFLVTPSLIFDFMKYRIERKYE